jgi:hypothetical protein
VSTSSGAHGTRTECNVSKAKTVKNGKARKYFGRYLSVDLAHGGNGTSPRPVCIMCTERYLSYFTSVFVNHQIDLNKHADVCTDSATSMTRKTLGVVARINTVSKISTNSHCILHRHAWAVKIIPNLLKSVSANTVQIVKCVKARPLNSRPF